MGSNVEGGCGCGGGPKVPGPRSRVVAAGLPKPVSGRVTVNESAALPAGLLRFPAHMAERIVAEAPALEPSPGLGQALNAIFAQGLRDNTPPDKANPIQGELPSTPALLLEQSAADHASFRASPALQQGFERILSAANATYQSSPSSLVSFRNGTLRSPGHLVDAPGGEQQIDRLGPTLSLGFNAILAEPTRVDGLQNGGSKSPLPGLEALLGDRTTSPDFQRPPGFPPPIDPPPAEPICECALECSTPGFQVGTGPISANPKECDTGVGGFVHGLFYLVHGPWPTAELKIRATTPKGDPTKGLEFARGWVTSFDEADGFNWQKLLTEDMACPTSEDFKFTMWAKKAGTYKVWATWDGVKPCEITIKVVKCACTRLTCAWVGDRTKEPPKDPPKQEKKWGRVCKLNLDLWPEIADMSSAELKAMKGGFQFLLETTGYDYVQHKVEFELVSIAGSPTKVFELKHGSHIGEAPTAPFNKLEYEMDCPERVWCTVDLVNGDGKLIEGEMWLVARFDGKRCGRNLISVRHGKVCSLEETRLDALASQDSELSKPGSFTIDVDLRPGSGRLSPTRYADRLAGLSGDEDEQLLGTMETDTAGAFISASCSTYVETDFKFVEKDCCCIYATDVRVKIVLTCLYTGFSSNPFAEMVEQIQDWGESESAQQAVTDHIASIADQSEFGLPKCKRATRGECRDWRLTDDEQKAIGDSICAMVTTQLQSMVAPLPPQDGDGEPEDIDSESLPNWGSSPGGAMESECADTANLPVVTFRLKTYLSTSLTGEDLEDRKREVVKALWELDKILLQCCIRIFPHDMEVSAIKRAPGDGTMDFAGVPAVVATTFGGLPYRTSLIVLDDQAPGQSTFVGRVKEGDPTDPTTADPGAAGTGECGVPGWSYGVRAAAWILSGRVFAHEIGHNAGLACTPGDHIGYNADIHVMGGGAGNGIQWKEYDCVALRRFAEGLPQLA